MLVGEWSFFFLFLSATSGLGCGTRVTLPRGIWDLTSLTRDQIPIPCIARQILYHWTTREVPHSFLKAISWSSIWWAYLFIISYRMTVNSSSITPCSWWLFPAKTHASLWQPCMLSSGPSLGKSRAYSRWNPDWGLEPKQPCIQGLLCFDSYLFFKLLHNK